MKTGTKVWIGLAVLLLLVFAGSRWFLVNKLDGIVQRSVVESVSRELGTEFSMDSLAISIPRTSVDLRGITIANPEGYSERPLLTLDLVRVELDFSTIRDQLIVIEEVTIVEPMVNYEINDQRVSNLDVLKGRMGGGKTSQAGPDSNLLIIEKLEFVGGTISASAARDPEKELVFDFPDVSMTDLGAPDGAPPEQLGNEISAVLIQRAMDAAKRAGVDALVEEQKERLLEKVEEKLEEKLGDLLKRD